MISNRSKQILMSRTDKFSYRQGNRYINDTVTNRKLQCQRGSENPPTRVANIKLQDHDPPDCTLSSSNTLSNRSILRRRIIFGILVVCITLSKASDATSADLGTTEGTIGNKSDVEEDLHCTKAAVEEFPPFLFNAEQRANGGLVVHFLFATYLIFALGSICDDYFVPVLEIICETLNLSPDVAGATFMAAGTSSPEFFTNVMGTFVTKSDLGIGTIVGSAVFNIFGVISVCGLFAGRKINLDWYPITRDCIIYGLTVLLLIIVLLDEKVFWWESLVMVGFYLIYIGLMFCNQRMENWAYSTKQKVRKRVANQTVPNESTPLHTVADKGTQAPVTDRTKPIPTVAITSASTEFLPEIAGVGRSRELSVTGADLLRLEALYCRALQPQNSGTPSSNSDLTTVTETTGAGSENEMALPNSTAPDVGDAAVEEITTKPVVKFSSSKEDDFDDLPARPPAGYDRFRRRQSIMNPTPYKKPTSAKSDKSGAGDPEAFTPDEEDEEEEELEEILKYPWERPVGEGCFANTWWALFFPMNILFFLTIPDVRRAAGREDAKWCNSSTLRKLTPLSFFCCIAWIGVIAYIVTWMITIIGFTIGVPDTVMGLSFLAVGTSIPEVFSSLIVCKQGKGSMAVSNSIGSNTFDILLCLGLPWMVKALLIGTSSSDQSDWFVRVNSQGLSYTVTSLLLSVIILYCVLLASRFVLSRTVAFVCLTLWAVFLTVSLLFELNVFFVVNLPMCPSDY